MADWKSRARIFAGFGTGGIVVMMTLGILAMPSIYLSGKVQSVTLFRYTLLADYVDPGDQTDKADIERRIDSFIDDTPSQLNALRKKVDEKDGSGTRSVAHALKGSAATAAAEGLYAIALALEKAGTDGRLDQCSQMLPEAIEAFERFRSSVVLAGWV